MRAFLTLCLIAVATSEKLGYNYSPSSILGRGSTIGGGYSSGSAFGGVLSGGSLSSGSSYSSIGGLSGGGFSSVSGIGSSPYSIGGGISSGGLSTAGGIGSGSYSIGGGLSSGGLSTAGGIGSGSYSIGGGLSSGGLISAGGVGSGSYSIGSGLSSGGLSSAGGIGSASYASGSSYSAPAQVVTELNKEYFFHSAPEDSQDAINSQNIQTTLKKNLRVVFIKAPENNGFANAALQVAKQATEDQTAIYVLTKEADVSDITKQLQQISEVHSKKPEVHFVKYKTQEDALNAQRTIQAQYDALGGSSKSSDEGVAPILNYASNSLVSNYQESASQASGSSFSTSGSLSAYAPSSSYSAQSGTGTFTAPSASLLASKSSYLPPVPL